MVKILQVFFIFLIGIVLGGFGNFLYGIFPKYNFQEFDKLTNLSLKITKHRSANHLQLQVKQKK